MTRTDRRQLAALLEARAKEKCPHCAAGSPLLPDPPAYHPLGFHANHHVCGDWLGEKLRRALELELRREGLEDEPD